MTPSRADIIAKLQRQILPLQGFKPQGKNHVQLDLGEINNAFADNVFPIGAVHEFVCENKESSSSTCGFISGIIGSLIKNNGVSIFISSSRKIFPPSLLSFGINPERMIFIDLPSDKDVFWTTRECLKCEGISAVVSEMNNLDFTQSRKLQLAVESSRVTGFILNNSRKVTGNNSCMTRWRISPLASDSSESLPGIGHILWNVELEKVRNGRPGNWVIGWHAKGFFTPDTQSETSPHWSEFIKRKAV